MRDRISTKQKRQYKTTWTKILGYCKKYSAIIAISLIFAVIGTVLTLIGPDKISKLTNLIEQGFITGIDMSAVTKIGIILVTLYAISFVLTSVEGWIMTTVTQRVSQNMRKDISEKINRLPMSYFHKTSNGDILSRVTNDVDTVAQSLSQSINTMVSAVTLFIGSLIMMFVTNWIMAITAIAATLIGFALMSLIAGRSQKYFATQQKRLGAINGYIEEIYAGHTVVKAYNGEKKSMEEFDKLNGELKNSAFKAQCLSGMMMPLMTFVGNLGYVAVCVVGAALAANGQITFGVIIAFTMYVRYFTQPLSQMAQAVQSLQSATAAGERVFDFLGAKEMQNEDCKTATLGKAQGKVEFSHVKFGYEDSDRTVIRDFSAIALPGQKVAIVGPTGAGKTTLVNLLMRFNEIQDGQILIDGVPTDEVRRAEVRKQFCMVLQDTWLFEGSVRENLAYNTPDVSDEKLDEACKAVGLEHFIKTLPDGYDTALSDSISLSQGQKQQLTIARAMLADRPMLILDEATSSVDTRTELQIQSAMDALMKGRTSFVIAHRLSTIKNSDMILVLKDGDIIVSGNLDELLAKGGFFAELYN
ncbi:MAG: ABC transporter ATP-binding protein/permease, partial [Clostridia bacterium]|nr:ABC transporter ATP-binding protein/permease [Clostridia bacterium]